MPRLRSYYVTLTNRDLLQELLDKTEDGSIIRDVIRERMTRAQIGNLYDFLAGASRGAVQAVIDEEEQFPIRTFAQKCIADGYWGQDMRDPDNARLYFHLAAEPDSDVDEKMETHEPLQNFWKAARFGYDKWNMRKKLEASDAQRPQV
jgi:hypothetical protein